LAAVGEGIGGHVEDAEQNRALTELDLTLFEFPVEELSHRHSNFAFLALLCRVRETTHYTELVGLLQLYELTLASLVVATIAGLVLRRAGPSPTVTNLNQRIVAWWVLCGVTAAAIAGGWYAVLAEFAIVSAAALWELSRLTRTGPAPIVLAIFYYALL